MSGHSEVSAHGAHQVVPGEPPHVHHMDSDTAYSAAKLGMWLFLATEVLLFGGLFAAFAIYRYMYLDIFHEASRQLDWRLGAINTVVLLFSSVAAALAVDDARQGNNKGVRKWMITAIVCGFIFLIIKFIEYSSKYEHGFFPGLANFGEYKMFFGLYYCMTGLHGLHVIIGMVLLGWVAWKSRNDRFSARYYTPVEIGALYWHLVDLIWIYLFPLLYLVG